MSALAAYMDAVVTALADTEVGVRDHESDDDAQSIEIDLDPTSAVRQPFMVWTPSAGWRIAVACRGNLRPATIRYLALGQVPSPADVARLARLWLDDPDVLTRVAPYYTAPSCAALNRRLSVHGTPS